MQCSAPASVSPIVRQTLPPRPRTSGPGGLPLRRLALSSPSTHWPLRPPRPPATPANEDESSIGGGEGGDYCVEQEGRRRRRRKIPANFSACRFSAVPLAAERVGFTRCPDNDFTSAMLVWSDCSMPPDRVSELRGHQRVNHFPGMGEICRKDWLGRNMARAARLQPRDFDFVPQTWCLPQESQQFQQYLRDAKKAGKRPMFISKPANGAMGHGIRVYRNGDQVSTSPENSSIVQRYLAKPFLVDGFKCDLRIYVLVTSCDPLRIYFYNDGLLRLSTEKYEDPRVSEADRPYMHLTNYSINKRSDQYEKGADDSTGSKRSIRFLNEYLQHRDHDVAQLWRNIIDLIIKTVLVAYPQVLLQYRMCRPGAPPGASSVCFEILGFDIMLDHQLKPWLLEVNRSPSFGIDEAIDRKVKLGMLEEAFTLLNIRLSDRRRCQAAQKADALRRLLQSGNAESAHRRQQLRRREELSAQLLRLRREAQAEDRETRSCHRFRRVFPCDDRIRQDGYVRLLLRLFRAHMEGRAPALLRDLEARYDPRRPGVDELADMLSEMSGGAAPADVSHSSSDSDEPDDSVASSDAGTAAAAAADAAQRLQQRRPSQPPRATTARLTPSGRSRPATSRLQSMRPSSRSSSLQPTGSARRRSAQHRRPHQLRAVLEPQQPDSTAAAKAGSEEAAKQLQRQLAEVGIRFPGRSPAEAAEVLGRVRASWKFHRPRLAAYWLARLDDAKRRQVLDIVRQTVATAVQRAAAGCLTALLNRLFSRLLSSNGQGLWNSFSPACGWEAGLTQSQAELLCCRRVVRLCQDCLLTVYLCSSQGTGDSGIGRPQVALG